MVWLCRADGVPRPEDANTRNIRMAEVDGHPREPLSTVPPSFAMKSSASAVSPRL
jgi:hypothetical protein